MGETGITTGRLASLNPSRASAAHLHGSGKLAARTPTERIMNDPGDHVGGCAVARPQSGLRASRRSPLARPAIDKGLIDRLSAEERLDEVAQLLWTGLKRWRVRESARKNRDLAEQNALDISVEESGHATVPLALRESP